LTLGAILATIGPSSLNSACTGVRINRTSSAAAATRLGDGVVILRDFVARKAHSSRDDPLLMNAPKEEERTMTFRFHHVHILCKDLEKMIGFFTEALEAHLVRRKKFGTADGASLDLQGTTVNLRVARSDERVEGDASRTVYGYNHIGLEVDDIEAAHTDLSGRGYSFFMPPTDIPDLRIAFFRGPEEIVIELVQRMGAGS
jgi:catechol 2,3-dioxygenase-like lactoylglutathione lyase family enzyme